VTAIAIRVRAWVQLGRISNLPTVWSNVLAGVILGGGELSPSLLMLLSMAHSLFYVGGMFLNDAFDRRFDEKARPERPIPSGRVGAAEVFVIGFGLLAAGLSVLAIGASGRGSFAPVLCGVGLAAAIVAYDAWHKNNPLSPVLMGLCRMGVYLTSALMVNPRPKEALGASVVLLAYLIGLTFVAKQESLKQPGNLWPVAFLAAPFVYAFPALLVPAAIWLAFAVWVWLALRRVWQRQIGAAVVQFIAGICLLDGLLIARTLGNAATLPVLFTVACFGLTLFAQRYVKGT
jgi:4-hydroxybenzoate polyprenyltransferase